MTDALIYIVENVIWLYSIIIFASVVLSWLVAFNVVNPYNQFVRTLRIFCERATEPLLRPIRRMLPDLGGIDISPVILLIAVQAVGIVLVRALQGKLFS
jgi:YggT family protein